MKRRRLRRAAIVALGLVVAAEVAARFAFGLGNPPLWEAHPQIEYLFKPNQDLFRFGHHILVNQYGMRSEPFPTEKAAGEYRILVFGDSVVNGGAQTSHEALATSLLQAAMSKPGRPAVVGNVSAGSWGPGNWLGWVKTHGFLGADVVVLVTNSDDSGDNPTFAPLDPVSQPTERPLSALSEAATRYLPMLLGRRSSAGEAGPLGPASIDDEALKTGLRDLGEFFALARRSVPRVVVMQHWTRRELRAGQADPGFEHIRRAAKEAGLEAVSLAGWFQGLEQEAYRDNVHLNERGQARLFEALRASLGDRP